jgi:hypothetical protein
VLSGYDRERIEILLRERAHGLTRTPLTARPRSLSTETPPEPPAAHAPAALLEPEPPQPRPPHPPRTGTCGDCARPIGAAHMRVVPDALRCIDCQRAFEAAAGGV